MTVTTTNHTHTQHIHNTQMDVQQTARCEREYYVRHILLQKGLKFHAENAICGPLLLRWPTEFERRTSQSDTSNEYRLCFYHGHDAFSIKFMLSESLPIN